MKKQFLFLSFVSGVIEIGSIYYSFSIGYGISFSILVGGFYQLGNLVPLPITISKRLLVLFNLLSIFFSITQ